MPAFEPGICDQCQTAGVICVDIGGIEVFFCLECRHCELVEEENPPPAL